MIDVRFQRGLHLPELDLWLDPWDAKPRAFVSHAHADHFARHESALCSDVTAQLVRKRFHLAESRIEAVSFHVPVVRDGFRLRLLPAGHICGSAMLHVTRIKDNASLLYTGDFKTRRGRTSENVNFLSADVLIMETTFGLPGYEFPPPMEIEASILRFVHDAFADGETPVLLGYSLGKAQEALALMAANDIPALLHPTVAAMTAACRAAECDVLPEPVEFDGHAPAGHVVIAPPNAVRSKLLRGLKSKRVAMLTGWAMQPGAKFRYRVDEVFPLSDHADHPGLMECVQRVRPKKVLTVHGFAKEFATELRGRGIDAWCAMGGDQLELPIAQPAALRTGATAATRHIRAISPLADFGDLCRLVGETSSRLAKIDFLASYLKGLESDDDLRLAAVWLTGEALPRKSGKRPLHVGGATIRRALLAIPNVREERYREISLSQNDAARTARLVLQEIHLKPERLDLPGLAAFFHELLGATGSLDRIERLAARLATLHPVEGETVVKLLTGDLRIGLKEGLVEDAIAAAFGADPAEVRHAHMLTGNIGETALLAKHGRLGEADLRPLVPVKCMLASPLERDVEDDRPLFEKLPFSPPVWLEPKYDGIRAQLHKHGDEVALFSRDLRPLEEFPELLTAARALPGDFILDGEVIAYAEGRKLGFADLQKRLGRKMADGDLFSDESRHHAVPLRFIAFDLLWRDGEDLLEKPLAARRGKLEAMELAGAFEIIAIHSSADPAETEAHFKSSLQAGHEGLIAKDPQSPYSPGRRGKSWIKLKGVMPTLDCVVVAAEQGHGKRSDVLSDYTFAVRDETNGQLRVIGKAYSGLTDDEIEDLTEHFTRHTLRKEKRKRHVEPNIVLEIAFDAIRASSRHDSGLALRFPRIKAIRRDKTVEEIDTLQSARALL